ncbi:MAG: ABC transporter ATP-binding protein [Pseudomonadota bacterium]
MSLAFRGISHQYGRVVAVDNADLEAARGEIACLFGPSGCGKTTLLRLAAGLERLQAGVVELDGAALAAPGRETPPEERPIGMVFQDYVLFPHMTVEKNIAFGLAGMKNAKAVIAAQLEALQIGDLAARFPHELSGGQQQRVALARALAREPKALLLDEPFASIDAVLRRRLREDLRRILKEKNVAVVLVTHDPEEALALGDRIALMRAGRIVEAATPEELFRIPKTPDGAQIFPGSQTIEGVIQNGRLVTPIGAFDAQGLGDGPGVAVMREGALGASPDGEGDWTVADCRFAGPGWTAYLEAPGGHGLLRVGIEAPLPQGARVALSCDPSLVFCYEKQ